MLAVCARLFFISANLTLILSQPLVVGTWNFKTAVDTAFEALQDGNTHVEAVVEGCTWCEINRCDGTVGPGNPNEHGETTLDAMVMDGATYEAGSVACLKRILEATKVAHAVMKYSTHSLIVGEDATQFALSMGFEETDLSTNETDEDYKNWLSNNCQPNNWKNVKPDPNENCGPYEPSSLNNDIYGYPSWISPNNHDTIGLVALDENSNIAAACSTNGMKHKIPGRVGDSPIIGIGAYADNNIGAAAATGSGDIMIKFAPSFQTVLNMAQGHSPMVAAQMAVAKISETYPDSSYAVVAVNKTGHYGAGCYGMWNGQFPFTIRDSEEPARVETVACTGF